MPDTPTTEEEPEDLPENVAKLERRQKPTEKDLVRHPSAHLADKELIEKVKSKLKNSESDNQDPGSGK